VLDLLSNLKWHTWSNPSLFQSHMHLFGPSSPLYHLLRIPDILGLDPIRDPAKVLALARLMCLLWLVSLFVAHARNPTALALYLDALLAQLSPYGLDGSTSSSHSSTGSPMMLCWLLLKRDETLELHEISWSVVRHVNVVKAWNPRVQHALAALLYGYLAGEAETDAHQRRHDLLIEGVLRDMAGNAMAIYVDTEVEREIFTCRRA
jgi:hypothetical protein